ncbi:Membrane-associated lipoprotein precursor, partial [Metamycoplasma alkalescens]
MDDNIITFGFTNSSKEAISKIFDGTDFLKEEFTATNFLSQKSKNKFPNLGSFVDFAVFEIDFSKIKKEDLIVVANDQPLTSKYVNKKDNDFAENLAKEITNDYVNNVKNHVKFKKDSYLKDYKKIDYPIKGKLSDNIEFLYAVGW